MKAKKTPSVLPAPERKRVTCKYCIDYSNALRRCLRGKVNPPTKKGTRNAIQFYGPNGVCLNNPFKQELVGYLIAVPMPAPNKLEGTHVECTS